MEPARKLSTDQDRNQSNANGATTVSDGSKGAPQPGGVDFFIAFNLVIASIMTVILLVLSFVIWRMGSQLFPAMLPLFCLAAVVFHVHKLLKAKNIKIAEIFRLK
jgi:hypothetical protein